ncbi:MAG TPA: hypothetical protein VJT71_20325 [Pyrinomonadaceae bacterium]|nr:hypothetical protein [Pyrinomonadaceae bacterium]
MKRVLIVVVLVISAATLGLWRSNSGIRQGLSRAVSSSEDVQGQPREEIRKSFELQPGARIEVAGINGKVDIQTSDTHTAEVYVLRTAKTQDGLKRREVTIEQTSNGIIIKTKQVGHGFWEHIFGSKAKEDVTIKAPRQIALALRGINGRVTGGDIDGALEAKGINGHVDLGQATESAELSGINGNISVTLNKLGSRGARLSGINGGIELKLAADLNADLTAKGMNGSLRSEIAGVTVNKGDYGSNYSARIGDGGAPITMSGINGNVRLTQATIASTASDKKPSNQKQEKVDAGVSKD